MKNIVSLCRRRFSISWIERAENTVAAFSTTEKILFGVFAIILMISGLTLLYRLNSNFLVEIPSHGGSFTEGVVGAPHFINPLFATSDVDRDLTNLIYSGLMKVSPEGKLIPDLAETVTPSEDGRTYTFTIRDNAVFHDGEPVTADDVEFTIKKAVEPGLKSPKRANWEGVEFEKIGEKEFRFVLKQPYAPFLENTTLGILPKHLWKNISTEQFTLHQLNIEPIGSGPYKITSITREKDASITNLALSAFSDYTLGRPYISDIDFIFYPNEDTALTAFLDEKIDSIANLSAKRSETLKNMGSIQDHSPLPRIFGVFFNQNQAPVFANKEVKEALQLVINREDIVREVLYGYGTAVHGPLPAKLLSQTPVPEVATSTEALITKAKGLLEKAGWKLNAEGVYEKKIKTETVKLSFNVSTSNASDLIKTAEILKTLWQKIGVSVNVKVFEIGDLNQTVIRPRKYDALLFGEIIGRDIDLYPFWHSSQRNDPGLNIALYTNSKVDKLLEEARTAMDTPTRLMKLESIQTEIRKDTPAIFLYSPDFIYITSRKIHRELPDMIFTPSDRFSNVQEWYVETDMVWDIDFLKNRKN